MDFGDVTMMIDPYLSDSAKKLNPKSARRMPVSQTYLHFHPDYLCITHSHIDHLDPETVPYILNTDKPITVFAPYDSWCEIRKQGKGHNYVLLDRHTSWTANEFSIHAVKAAHSDLSAVGYVIFSEGKTYYFSGDTLYHTEVVQDLNTLCPNGIDYAFLPINGVGNNVNAADAARLAAAIGAKCAIPAHWGLFDALTPEIFSYPKTVSPEIYQPLNLE